MRITVSLLIGGAMWCFCLTGVDAHAGEWTRVNTGAPEREFLAVAADAKVSERISAATRRAVYASSDGGQHWTSRFSLPETAPATRIALNPDDPDTILVATGQGLYGSFDGGAHWTRVFSGAGEGQNACTAVVFHPSKKGTALLGTQDGLFISADRGQHWKVVDVPQTARQVVHIAFSLQQPEQLYLVAANGLFVGDLSSGVWQQRRSAIHAEEAEVEEPDVLEAIETGEESGFLHRLSAVAVDPRDSSTVYLAGVAGLEKSADGGATWQRVTREGLIAPAISRLVLQTHSPLTLYAATARGVSRYDPTRDQWTLLTQGLASTHVNDLAVTRDRMWAATAQGLYRYDIPPEDFSESPSPSPKDLLANFAHEPTIADVREAAIRYAEVHPDKIRRWRQQAALKALLPTVNLGLDHDRSRNVHVDEGSFPNFQIIQTKDGDASVDVSINWNLSELIWNEDQTAIDTRSKLMVQLRDDVVDEITRTYFERRRLQIALLTNPPPDEQKALERELRVQELTALIDGLTGGEFSKRMKVVDNP